MEEKWREEHLYPNGRIKAYSRYFIEPNMSSPLPPPSKPPLENVYFSRPDNREDITYLKIKILSAHYLRRLCNVCVIHLNEKTFVETKKCSRSDNPVWDDLLVFRNIDISQITNMRISLWDKHSWKDKQIASATMDCSKIEVDQINTHILDLNAKRGKLYGVIVFNTIVLPAKKKHDANKT